MINTLNSKISQNKKERKHDNFLMTFRVVAQELGKCLGTPLIRFLQWLFHVSIIKLLILAIIQQFHMRCSLFFLSILVLEWWHPGRDECLLIDVRILMSNRGGVFERCGPRGNIRFDNSNVDDLKCLFWVEQRF